MTNYFDFYNLPIAFELDVQELRAGYISNSKKYHPDYHTLANSDHQEKILELSTRNNEAWKTLSDRQKRIAHILTLYQAMPEEGKATVPQDFLMEMMDLNEALMELSFEPEENKKKEVLQQLEEFSTTIEASGTKAMQRWDQEHQQEDLEAVRDYYLKVKYINRIKERIRDN